MRINEIFEKCASVIMSKRADYTSGTDYHENFKRAAEVGSWFPNDDKPYAILVATKLARLGALLSSGKTPNNESVNDSFEDLINYCALWYERRSSTKP